MGGPALAQTGSGDCTATSPECAQVGELNISLSVGLGGRTNPIQGNADIPLVALPQISYYGKRFFLENLEVGVTLHESERSTFNLIASPGYDRVFFVRNDLQNVIVSLSGGGLMPGTTNRRVPIARRHTTYLAGPEWIVRHGRVTGYLNALYEITGEHEGVEVRTAVSAPLIESKASLVASAGVTWKSSALVNYYYGAEGLYEPGSALNPFVKFSFNRPLSERVAFKAFAHYEWLGQSVADSPIVSDAGSITAFVGFDLKIR
ncbi:MAG: MipA/OmpV family protein [Gammaproteobacteria bacterium]|nr:MipA/OmpV family protein [Gammaproteobacteria bacterium]